MRNIYAVLGFILICFNANAAITKCIDQQEHIYYIPSDNAEKIQNILNGGGHCNEAIKPLNKWTDAEKREALERYKLEQEIAKENYNKAVRETAKFLDDVEAARKRK